MLASERPIAATAEPGTEIADILAGIALLSAPGDDEALAASITAAMSHDFSASVEKGLRLAESLSAARVLLAFERLLAGKAALKSQAV